MKKIVLVGGSGSIGVQTIDVIEQHPDQFQLVGLGVGERVDVLENALKKHKIEIACTKNEEDAIRLSKLFPSVTFYFGEQGLNKLASYTAYDVLVNALVGFVGLKPTLAAIETKHDVALANKETLVVAGELIQKALKKNHCFLYPIDSEHSAIFQCLQGNQWNQVARLIITASGGSFYNYDRKDLQNVTVEQALNHPNWAMGAKITIDSATMMNKGFEVMEAHYLFDIPYENIDVLIHRESIIHSMVEFVDHSVVAQLGVPDMRLPIQYALSWPSRLSLDTPRLDLAKIGTLHFANYDENQFPLLKLAYEVGKKGGNLPAILNASNEVANQAFRDGKIKYLDIERIIFQTLENATYESVNSVEDLLANDHWARKFAESLI